MLLWFLASGDKYASIADRFGVSESTVCCAVRNLLKFIQDHLLERIITWPTSEERREMSEMYMELKHFPGIVGMLDGSHIPIKKPEVRGVDYYNRKDFHSIILQAVVREDMTFTNVYTGWPGKVHDARVFRRSPLYHSLQQMCGDGHILADSAYPNLPWVLAPFRDNGQLTPVQRHFNRVHASIRSTVERAFAVLKGRFPRLKYINQKDIETMIATILTACVIHNICIWNNDELEDALSVVDEVVPQIQPNAQNYDGNAQQEGACKRLRIARTL
jgi:hypothetical protein